MIELLITGRLVGGHPMRQNAVIDDRTKQPKMQQDGITPRTNTYLGVAIPKGAETHWNQTEWGAQIWSVGQADWPNGEFNAPTFAWKIVDGDSAIPNKAGNKPCDREGYPGHWVINCTTELGVKCFHAGRYDPHQQIQNENEIKAGDYCRVLIDVKGNNPSQSPGIYINPKMFELSRAGVEIVLSTGPSAESVFGGSAAVLPQNAQVDPNATTPPAAPVAPPAAPAYDMVTPPKTYDVGGTQYTADQLKASGWSDEQIAALG